MHQIVMLSLDDKSITSDLDRAGYRKMGITVRQSKNWSGAAKVLAAEPIDVIVINFDVVGLDGLEVIKHVRYSEWKAIPIVGTSVQSSARLRQNAIASGADLFVEQPLPRDYFIEKIKSLLDQKTRTNQRVNMDVEAKVKLDKLETSCEVVDLSATGVLLSTKLDLKPGKSIDISFQFGANLKPVVVRCEVVRKIELKGREKELNTGIGIRFLEFKGDGQQRLESFVARTSDKSNRMAYYL